MSVEKQSQNARAVTVAIPTFGRDHVMTETVRLVIELRYRAAEILVMDQTSEHDEATTAKLVEWDNSGTIRWMRLKSPSITAAMNRALIEASNPVVLFLDDDIAPLGELIAAHAARHLDSDVGAVVGQVLQPGESPISDAVDSGASAKGLREDLGFRFNSTVPRKVRNCMAGNLSVKRKVAIDIGGFDENFMGVAYRFETEFCRRLFRYGMSTFFEPSASIRHLKSPRGGTRTHGNHLTSARPEHGVGDYYFAMREGSGAEATKYILRRLFREIRTRFHLTHPWWIPVKFFGEIRGLAWAMKLVGNGPKLLAGRVSDCETESI